MRKEACCRQARIQGIGCVTGRWLYGWEKKIKMPIGTPSHPETRITSVAPHGGEVASGGQPPFMFAVGFLLYHPEINSCTSLSLALWLLGAEIKNRQRTTEIAVVFFSLGNETTLGQSKGAQDARRRISLPWPLQVKLQPWDPLTPQNLVG